MIRLYCLRCPSWHPSRMWRLLRPMETGQPRSHSICSTHSWRREVLRSFPLLSRSRWVCPASDQTPHAAAVGSLSQALSAGQAVITGCRHRVYATCRTSAMSRRSGAQPPRLSRLDPAELQPAEASIRYLPASIIFQPSLIFHFKGQSIPVGGPLSAGCSGIKLMIPHAVLT